MEVRILDRAPLMFAALLGITSFGFRANDTARITTMPDRQTREEEDEKRRKEERDRQSNAGKIGTGMDLNGGGLGLSIGLGGGIGLDILTGSLTIQP